MKKLFLLAAVLVFSLTLCAGTTQMAVFLTGKNAHLRVLDKGGFNVKERTKWDKKTGTVIYRCFFFNITARSTSEMRKMTLKFEAAKGDLAVYIGHKRADKKGLIFTFIWAFDEKSDWYYVEHVSNIFEEQNAEVYYVELVADQTERLRRNVTENRLKNKASKRDIELSNQRVINDDATYRLVSNEGEVTYKNYIKIDNTKLSPEEVVEIIRNNFKF